MIHNIKKYLEFKGTISGGDYIVRNLIASGLAFAGGFVIGFGIGINDLFLTILGIILLTPTLWFSLATIYKRINAFYPDKAGEFTALFAILQMVSEFGKGETWATVISIIIIISGLFLIFKNSNIENHEG
jgi:uncharacterized membrane protein YhaH (DUF805 family)